MIYCFHAQQAAEKAIKAVYAWSRTEPEHIHNISSLLNDLPDHVDVPEPVRRAAALTVYAVEIRYPDDFYEVTERDLAEAVALTRTVVSWAISIIEPAA